MRLALGKPTTVVITNPDGTQTAHVIDPDPSSEEHLSAVRRAETAMQEPDEDLLADHVVITATGEEADRLLAWTGRGTRNVLEP